MFYKVILWVLLNTLTFAAVAQPHPGLPLANFRILPEHVTPNSMVELRVVSDCSEGFPELNGQEVSFDLVQSDSVISLFMVFGEPMPCPVFPPIITEYPLGILPAGDYDLQVFAVLPSTTFPVDPLSFEPVYTQSLAVTEAAEPVPIFDIYGIVVMCILLLVYARRLKV